MWSLMAHSVALTAGTLLSLPLQFCGPCSNSYLVPASGSVGRLVQ